MIKIGTWNVRETNEEGAIRRLIETKKKYKIDTKSDRKFSSRVNCEKFPSTLTFRFK
jgi:hypothetical protein